MKKILVVGSLNMDETVAVSRFPQPGETILGKGLLVSPGGKGANQAYAVGRIGGRAKMLGCVGNDANGKKMLENLAKANVDTSDVRVLPDEPTGIAIIMNEDGGENYITVISGANARLDRDFIRQNRPQIEYADIILTQLETPMEAVEDLAALAAEHHKIFALDPAPARASLSDELLGHVDIMKPNETELSVLTGMPTGTVEEVEAAAGVLIGKGVGNVVTTLGGTGAVWTSRDGSRFFPGRKVEAVDTTAAGDTFLAALLCRLAEDADFEEAIPYANTASSIAVTRRGAQRSIPSAEEVDKIFYGGENK